MEKNSGSKILIIEDEEATRYSIKTILTKEGYDIHEASDGSHGLIYLAENQADLIILDIMLPGISGYYVCSQIRKHPEQYGTPNILMLTAKDSTEDLVSGFEHGADDYLRKPFDPRELVSRVAALFRRTGIFSKVYKYYNIVVDTEKIILTEDEKVVELSKREFDVILYFIINKGITITREKATQDIWDLPYYEGLRTLDTYIKVLKKKLPSIKDRLQNVRGYGYKLES